MIIGIGHRKRVGKDALALILSDKLRQRHKGAVYIDKFAGHLRDTVDFMFSEIDGFPTLANIENELVDKDTILPVYNKTIRDIYIATAAFIRSINPNALSAPVFDYYKDNAADNPLCIIADVRLKSEVDEIRRRNGKLIRVDRITMYPSDHVDDELQNYDSWDAVIDNNGSLADLEKQADRLMEGGFFAV